MTSPKKPGGLHPLRYVSTRGEAPELGFEDVMLAGLASDGGLYVPATWPHLSESHLRQLSTAPYEEVAFQVMQPFVADSVPEEAFRQIIAEAYASFRHPAVTPLKQLDDSLWLQELFHGPTLAFKDVAMQLLSRLMDRALEKRGARATIVGATSGDTGGAAIEAFKSSRSASIFILHPHGRVSNVQRRQMTTVNAAHVHSIALEGTFDDCQAIVKALFNDPKFREKQRLSGVNSINWTRIMAQMVYYVTAALALGAPGRSVSFTVPTGNFGNVFAGFSAKRLGLPIDKLVIATNPNDILDRTLKTGRYEVKGVKASTSPSMDIQVSSNFERLVYFAHERDVNRVRNLMESLRQSGSFTLGDRPLEAIRA
ncbi:MAG: threonine synthase, partial [Aestuariivirga sp.]